MNLRRLADAEVAGKRVLLRTSLNVPLRADGTVADDFRLRRGLPTLEHLVRQGAKVIAVGYLGREGASLKPVADHLARLAPRIPLRFFGESPARAAEHTASLASGEVAVLENIRREAGEEANDPALAEVLASLADLFVDDAFAEAHRPYASNVGVAQLLPSYAGLLLEEEVARLSEALTPPPGAFAVVGGAKFETKQPVLRKLSTLYGRVAVGGALANDFLKARGLSVGASLVSDIPVPDDLAKSACLLLPTDVVVSSSRGGKRICRVDEIRSDETIVDNGPETSRAWSEEISKSSFVLWNGPLGVFEKDFTEGTDALASALSAASCRAAVGGGDTLAAIEKLSFEGDRVFRSTGGGAMLDFLAEGTLPALEPLRMPPL